MRKQEPFKLPAKQKGIVLLVMAIIIILGIFSYAFSGISINQIKIEDTNTTSKALKKAKQALLAFAVVRSEVSPPLVTSIQPAVYGYLPCPANNNGDGNSVGVCDSTGENTVGWFPWRSLRLSPLKDGNGDCLLYAVSSTYKFNPPVDMLNQDSYGMFKVRNETGATTQGTTTEDRPVAIVFSSGNPMSGQNRNNDADSDCNNDPNNFSAYLDSFEVAMGDVIDNSDVDTVNPDQVDEFIHKTATSELAASPHNDRFITISREEIWDAVFINADFVQKMENLTQALTMCIASYANHTDNTSRRLPWPAKTDLGGADYGIDASYQDDMGASNGFSGRYPFNVENSNGVIDPTSTLLNTGELFNMADCSALLLTGSGAGVTVDLVTSTSEYRKLWNHWKDHFFYILSKGYEPDNTGSSTCASSGACITVNIPEYAGAVIFSGKRLDGIIRSDKSVLEDYLEDSKATVFDTEVVNKTGIEAYTYTSPQTDTINDIMYCIEDNPIIIDDPLTPLIDETALTVVECS